MGPILIGLVFAAILGTVAYQLIRKARQSSRNDALPVLTAPATVSGMRTNTIAQPADINPKYKVEPSTKFFARFRLHDSQSLEFELSNEQFAPLAEGQQGTLTYQGTRYVGFEKSP
jgi:Protein of unknown function (DUF2500)